MRVRWQPFILLSLILGICSCSRQPKTLKILGNIEEPQNEIASILAATFNGHSRDSVIVRPGVGSLANLDSLENGSADLGIVDNYSRFSDRVNAVMPLYPQVLHILHKREKTPKSLRDLFTSGKIFAGASGGGTARFVEDLIYDLGIDPASCEFVEVVDFFEADVIFSFTDLLTQNELRDLSEYKLFSLDDVKTLGQGSLAEGICTRHPQFEPYVIAKDVYGKFTETPILTLKVDALLVCRSAIPPETIFNLMEILFEHRQDLKDINPLMFNVSTDFSPAKLNFILHPGASNFLNRDQPGVFEKHADLLSVSISVFVALASGLYSAARWQRMKKKNKIDKYYGQLILYRRDVDSATNVTQLSVLRNKLTLLQEETINLVVAEKLLADESFSIFLNLSKIIMEEINQKSSTLLTEITL